MIFDRTKELLDDGAKLIRAEAELAAVRLKRAAISSAFVMMTVMLALLGSGLFVAGMIVMLAEFIGTAASLVAAGSFICIIAVVSALIIKRRLTQPDASLDSIDTTVTDITIPDHEPAEADLPNNSGEASQVQLPDGAADKPIAAVGEHDKDPTDLKVAAIDLVSKNPAAVGSVVFLALSIIGPGRALRLASRGAAAASMIATVVDTVREQQTDTERQK